MVVLSGLLHSVRASPYSMLVYWRPGKADFARRVDGDKLCANRHEPNDVTVQKPTDILDFDAPPAEPIEPFMAWLAEAEQQTDLPNPNAMALATVDADGQPSNRIVLLKDFDAHGAVFFTNLQSHKATALHAHPKASLLFHWDPLNRQIRIDGRVSQVSDNEADAYFATRPRGSQIGAWASDQSRLLNSRSELERRVVDSAEKYHGRDVPRPPHWGGFRVNLERVEFWQGREDRLHDRIVYTPREDGGWDVKRLFP